MTMIFQHLSTTVQVKHLWTLFLAIVLSFAVIDHHDFNLVPIWVINTNNVDNTKADLEVKEMLTSLEYFSDYSSNDNISYVIITIHRKRVNSTNFSSVMSFRLPNLNDVEDFVFAQNRETVKLHSPQPTAIKSNLSNSVRLYSGFYRGKLVYAAAEFQDKSSNIVTITLLNSHFEGIWKKHINCSSKNVNWSFVPASSYGKDSNLILSMSDLCGIISPRICGVIFVGFSVFINSSQYHYSVVAVSLEDGTLLWHHFPGDFESSTTELLEEELIASRFWKLRLLKQFRSTMHTGEMPWTVYLHSLSEIMPFTWYGDESMCIHLVRLNKHSMSLSDKHKFPLNAIVAVHHYGLDILDVVTAHPLARLSYKWKIGSTYSILPIYHSHRLFLRQLFSVGLHEFQTSSQVLGSTRVTSGFKIRENSVQNTADELIESDFSHTIDCIGLVNRLDGANLESDSNVLTGDSVYETHSAAYHGLCRPHRIWDYSRFGRSEWLEDVRKSVPPIISKRHITLSGLAGLWYSLMDSHYEAGRFGLWNDYSNHVQHRDHYDLYFLTSDGSLTSLSNHGYENWRVNAEVSWLQVSRTLASSGLDESGTPFNSHLHEIYSNNFQPGLLLTNIIPLGSASLWSGFKFGIKTNLSKLTIPILISTGWDSVSVVDSVYGKLLATHKLPTQPIGQPKILSLILNSNHNNSVISKTATIPSVILIRCNDMILGFVLTSTIRLSILIIFVISFSLSFCLLVWCFTLEESNEHT